MTSTENTPTDALDFDAWLKNGTTAVRTVELHNDRAIPDQLEILDARRKVAMAVIESGESSEADAAEVAAIDAEMDALYERWEASKETWVVRALADEEIDEITDAHPAEPMPKKPGRDAQPKTVTAYEQKMQAWAKRQKPYRLKVNCAFLELAVVRVETARGVATGITAEQLKAMHDLPGRQGDITVLMEAASLALKSNVEPPVPFSRRASETDPA